MVDIYFSDRESGPVPRVADAVGNRVWGGLFALISAREADDSFGYRFPDQCPDGNGPCGYDRNLFRLTAAAEIPEIVWPLSPDVVPSTVAIMDLLEFASSAIGAPQQGGWHDYFRHHHLDWDRAAGLARFVQDVNRLFARNGIAFELTDQGAARRLLPEPLRDALHGAVFHTGDNETDRLLETARWLIVAPNIDQRRDALEKLWDAFERLKTLEDGVDKRAQADALLDRVAGPGTPRMRLLLSEDALALTGIGNKFRIRHSEATQEMPEGGDQIDYLFQRMYAFIRLALKATGRGG